MSATVENLIITRLVKYLNDNRALIELPAEVYNNEHRETGTALWVQPNSGARKIKRYIGGSYEAAFPFTLCFQMTNPEFVSGRLAALDVPFFKLSEYLEARSGKVAFDATTTVCIEMTSSPSTSYKSKDGQTVEQSAVFLLEYHVKP